MSKILDIRSREILDSRGNPTLQTNVILDNGISASASVPSGASTGKHEAFELRDNDIKRYNGKGVLKAVENVNSKIKPVLIGKDPSKQQDLDRIMIDLDGTENKKNLGANAILSVSLACCRAESRSLTKPLYQYIQGLASEGLIQNSTLTPMFNVINGGVHGGGNLDFQEFMLVPNQKKLFQEKLNISVTLYHLLKSKLHQDGFSTAVGDEGGFAPKLATNESALDLLKEIIDGSGYEFGTDVSLSLDLASSTFYKENNYKIQGQNLNWGDWTDYLVKLHQKYNFLSLEDPLAEDDWDNWTKLTEIIGSKTKIVGDDLLCTNPKLLQLAIDEKACNSILVKVNQIGTLTETLEVIKLAKNAGFTVIISHRSGETNDDFIADLAVGVGADFVKFGAPARGERVAKYNRLLQIYQNDNYQ